MILYNLGLTEQKWFALKDVEALKLNLLQVLTSTHRNHWKGQNHDSKVLNFSSKPKTFPDRLWINAWTFLHNGEVNVCTLRFYFEKLIILCLLYKYLCCVCDSGLLTTLARLLNTYLVSFKLLASSSMSVPCVKNYGNNITQHTLHGLIVLLEYTWLAGLVTGV